LYTLARVILWPLSKLLFRLSIQGRDSISSSGPLILVANHKSYIDPILVGLASRRPIHYMAKSELWRIPVLGWLITRLNAFPVHRGTADRAVIRTALGLLEHGEIVLLFPEATRHRGPGLGAIHPGAGVIAQKAGVPIVPVALLGSETILPEGRRFPRFPKLRVVVGEPIPPASATDSAHEAKRLGTALINSAMRRVSEMSEAAAKSAAAPTPRRQAREGSR